jgi:hypothetical protein
LRKVAGLIALLILGAVAAVPATAQTAFDSPESSRPEVVILKPGQFVWYESEALVRTGLGQGNGAGNGISLIVSIPAQLAYVYRDGMLIAVSTVSTGREGKDTPTGEFTILEKRRFHRSNLYSNAPMPFMQRLTWDGIALHAGHLPGYPASHGCIRLPKKFAEKLFEVTDKGAAVSVIDEIVEDPRVNPFAGQPLLRVDTALLGGEAYNRVTAPASLIQAAQDKPSSWVSGPYREIVQPIPPGTQ